MNRSMLRIIIAVLTLVTAAIHFRVWQGPRNPIFLLNALGFLGLLVVNLVNVPFFNTRHKLAAYLLAGYAALTFVLYFVSVGGILFFSTLPVISKIDEALLVIAALVYAQKA